MNRIAELEQRVEKLERFIASDLARLQALIVANSVALNAMGNAFAEKFDLEMPERMQ